MNYYQARQKKGDDGEIVGWHYTCSNDAIGIFPVGYCTEHEPHETAEEAEECFRRYLLDGQREVEYGDWSGCVVCDEPTKKGLGTRPPLGSDHHLCDEHRNAEMLKGLTPRPTTITASY